LPQPSSPEITATVLTALALKLPVAVALVGAVVLLLLFELAVEAKEEEALMVSTLSFVITAEPAPPAEVERARDARAASSAARCCRGPRPMNVASASASDGKMP
jgi:hypothetical protein